MLGVYLETLDLEVRCKCLKGFVWTLYTWAGMGFWMQREIHGLTIIMLV